MSHGKFTSVVPQKTPENLIGIWSGMMDKFLTGFNFNGDGNGIFCYSSHGSDAMQKVKYASNTLYIQDGTELVIKKLNVDSLIVDRYSFGGDRYTFYQDPNLKEDSKFCSRN